MKKKIVIVTMLAALTAVPVFAAAADQDQQPQNQWPNQMFNHHQQMFQQAVDTGSMTADQAAWMNHHMQQMVPIMQHMMQNGGMMNGNMMTGHSNMNVNGSLMQNGGMMGNFNNK